MMQYGIEINGNDDLYTEPEKSVVEKAAVLIRKNMKGLQYAQDIDDMYILFDRIIEMNYPKYDLDNDISDKGICSVCGSVVIYNTPISEQIFPMTIALILHCRLFNQKRIIVPSLGTIIKLLKHGIGHNCFYTCKYCGNKELIGEIIR